MARQTAKRTRRKYSNEEKACALSRLAENSKLDSPVAATANELQMPLVTLFTWAQGRGIAQHVLDLVKQKNKTVADLYEEVAVLALVRQAERLSDPEACASAKLSELSVTGATATDKARLLRGDPTAITETRIRVTVEDAERDLQKFLPHFPTRAEAIEALRSVDPDCAEALAVDAIEVEGELVN